MVDFTRPEDTEARREVFSSMTSGVNWRLRRPGELREEDMGSQEIGGTRTETCPLYILEELWRH